MLKLDAELLREARVVAAEEAAPAKATREVVSNYLTWQVVGNGGDSIPEALELEARYRDCSAMVIQAAQASGAGILVPKACPTADDTAPSG